MKYKLIVFLLGILLSSCVTKPAGYQYSVIEAPDYVRERAVFYAMEYVNRGTSFELGGRSLLEQQGNLELDCSGLIVRVFQYAIRNTKYRLLFNDTNVSSLFSYFSIPVEEPTAGDFIFMGFGGTYPSHISIFVRMENDNIYFIDSTLLPTQGIDGVSLRYYKKHDFRFLSFGRLLLGANLF